MRIRFFGAIGGDVRLFCMCLVYNISRSLSRRRRELFTLYVFNENKAVARLAELLALKRGADAVTARKIRTAAALHDIGKAGIPDSILKKPGKLTKQEFEIIKTHTTIGESILRSIQGEIGVMARVVARNHHEHWDGQGYWGKRLDELPFYVEITAVIDVFVALLSVRPYKTSWPPADALDYIQSRAGTQFSPAMVEVFLSLIQEDDRVPAIFMERNDVTMTIIPSQRLGDNE